jgi:hypothetical protein
MLLHSAELLAPGCSVWYPAGHDVHCDDEGAVEYVPVGQSVHEADWVEEKLPAGHVKHTELDVAPTVEEAVPAGHAVHASAVAVEEEYVPLGQGVQATLDAMEKVPAAHG